MRRTKAWPSLRYLALLAVGALLSGCSDQTDISFFVLVKSSNYAQDSEGQLTLLNYHFFSEIFLNPGGSLTSATLSRDESSGPPMEYVAREDNYYVEGGHFDSVGLVDQAYPNGTYVFDIRTPTVQLQDLSLDLAGPVGATDIPAPITISLWQDEVQVNPLGVDPAKNLVIRWSEFSNGTADPRGIVDDMIFLVIADCQGERIFHTGLPFQGEYTTFRTTEMVVASGLLRPGQPYSSFVEFPHVVDSRVERGVPGFTSYATATYLDLRTLGPRADEACPDIPPPMDTGQTDRMDSIGVRPEGR
ncbi:MAG: hypothetical protein ACI9OJ_005434 [Myxococcota bacterium]|jgi:hypothetical protein